MSIKQLLLPQEEEVKDEHEGIVEAVALAYKPVPIGESDHEEGFKILPRIMLAKP
jgi:hypothetical protein